MGVQVVTKEKGYRVSFAALDKPGKFDKYGISLLIPKEQDEPLVAELMAARQAAANEALTSCWGGKAPKSDDFPVYDGDESEYSSDKGHWVLRCSSKSPVPVYDSIGNAINPSEVYAGCYVKVALNVKGGNWNDTNKYVTVYVNAIMKDKDGERIGGVDTSPAVFGVTPPASSASVFSVTEQAPIASTVGVSSPAATVVTEQPATPANPFGARV